MLSVRKIRGGGAQMDNLQIGPEQFARLSAGLAEYITVQRAKYFDEAVPLTAQQRTAVAGFFTAEVLDSRLLEGADQKIDRPDFYVPVDAMGVDIPRRMIEVATTLYDVIFSNICVPFTNVDLFHGLVHVEQCRQLGIEKFAASYLQGLLAQQGFVGIALEMQAYTLTVSYEYERDQIFCVEDAVRQSIQRQEF
jgi:hypothetical protein